MTLIVATLAASGNAAVVGADQYGTSADLLGRPQGGRLVDKIHLLDSGFGVHLHTGDSGPGSKIEERLDAGAIAGPTGRKTVDIERWLKKKLQLVLESDSVYTINETMRTSGEGRFMTPSGLVDASPSRLGGGILAHLHSEGACVVAYEGLKSVWPLDEAKSPYVAMGSGGMVADPFLEFVHRVLWREAIPSVEVALLGVYWVVEQGIRHGSQSGVAGRPTLAVVEWREVDPELNDDVEAKDVVRDDSGQSWRPAVRRLDPGELEGLEQGLRSFEKKIGGFWEEDVSESERPPEAPPKKTG